MLEVGEWKLQFQSGTRERGQVTLAGEGLLHFVSGEATRIANGKIEVSGVQIRPGGVGFPKDEWCLGEKNQGCNGAANSYLEELIAGQEILCLYPEENKLKGTAHVWSHTEQGYMAACYFGRDGKNWWDSPCNTYRCVLGFKMLCEGWVVSFYVPESIEQKTYKQKEREAENAKKGVWSDNFDFDAWSDWAMNWKTKDLPMIGVKR